MKPYLTALTPAARLTVWKALAIALAVAGLSAWRFTAAFPQLIGAGDGSGLRELVQTAGFHQIFGAGLVALCGVLALPGTERGAKTGYTLRRLPVEERVLTTLWGVQNTLVLLFYWASQIAVFLALAGWYLQSAPADTVTRQTLVLACYQTEFLHSLLPMADWPVLVRNVLGCAMLGMSAAAVPLHWRYGRKAFSALPLALASALAFPVPLDSLIATLLQLAIVLAALLLTLYGIWRWHVDET